MALEKADFEAISEADLQELIFGEVPEGLRIEYKRELYGLTGDEKREALKDVSAFANAHGGHLILGMEAQNGLPITLRGLGNIDPDAEINRLEQIIRTGIEPRIPGIRILPVSLSNGTQSIVVRIPKSWNPPHRVIAQNSNQFWIRNSVGAHEASVEELRSLFTFSSSATEQIRQFRLDRIKLITEGRGPRPLVAEGRLILHIVPLSAFSSRQQVDLLVAHARSNLFHLIGDLGPPSPPRFNFDGVINEWDHGYTQVFRNGIIEATRAPIVHETEGGKVIYGCDLEKHIFKELPPYINGLRQLGIAVPLIIMFTLEGVEGALYDEIRNMQMAPSKNQGIDRPVLSLPECVLEDYGADVDYHRAAKPAFDALWNAMGRAKDEFFNDEGLWVGDGSQ